ncbi:MAG TPA: TonB-dependent receptor [Steroidobacter sp.]|uniref:TonB-dependent receptor n=1 Tax=Steroidobacter sp. TaxID=1978227 RepID=UPI002EDB7FE5
MSLRAALKVALKLGATAVFAATLPLHVSHAASGDGSLVGKIIASDQGSLEGIEITVRNPETGFTRTVKAEADGSYRFPYLPVGKYIVEGSRNGSALGKLTEATVGLGTATTADVTVNLSNVEEIFVVGSRVIRAVDVRSTESATNLTRDDLERLPVGRDIQSVALLAPGLAKGDSGLCDNDYCGVSFGGSSIAENTVYINGLNVTDFYNRVGASAVPYAFYKEFQVKTGGYSVEFGRTTGGVINAVTRSGTNEFEYGTEVAWEPRSLQSSKTDRFNGDGSPRLIGSQDEYDRTTATFYASGPIVKDKLFFFALYEARDYQNDYTTDTANIIYEAQEDNGFWGAKIDWQINDRNLLELLAFSDENEEERDAFGFDYAARAKGNYQQTRFTENGGLNWSATYTAYLTDNFSAKALYGENQRDYSRYSQNDLECSRVRDLRPGGAGDVGCTTSGSVSSRDDTREAARLDFEWVLGEHQLRFGLDHETNTSDYIQYYPGPDRLLYDVNRAISTNVNFVPIGIGTDYVRVRQNEVEGVFETINSAYYLEDNWSITPNLLLNAGIRVEAFDNKNGEGDTYIKMDDMIAPRFGFSWDVKGDQRSKIFGNAGRYFLPVANVINIKQAGGFLDRRTFYYFEGFEPFDYNGVTRYRPILGAQFGAVDDSQGDGTVGDLRGEVDADMDPVYQDELILGFQSMLGEQWSWGVRGIYRKLNNAIDDMEITSTGVFCDGEPVSAGYVMGNPGEPVTIYSDTNCDGENDGWVTVDTGKAGWALYDDAGNYLGDVGYPKPKRNYKALELMIDRAWDDLWSFNAVYTLSWAKGNAEGPINSDTNFGDTGRTEAFDNPWVNFGSYGYLPNDRRHQLKVRGAYALGEHWELGGTLTVQSGRPKNALGECNPYDAECFYSFFVLNQETGQYELRPRGSAGTTPWLFDLGANVTYKHSFSAADLRVQLSVYNLLNQQRVTETDDMLGAVLPNGNSDYGVGTGYQPARYGLLTLKLDF